MAADIESYLAQAAASADPDEAMGYLARAAHEINREADDFPERLRARVPALRKAVQSVAQKSEAKGYSISVGLEVTYEVEWIVSGPVE